VRAAIDANDFALARETITPLLSEPTQRVCLLMAEIESEQGDHGKAREWTARAVRARRDPAWVADGYVSERWLPMSPLSGRIDAFVWSVPPESFAGPLLEQVAEQALDEAKAAAAPTSPAPILEAPPLKTVSKSAVSANGPAAAGETRSARRKPVKPVVAEPPLPDDPGPEPEAEAVSDRPRFKLFQW
jgi:HemY protein